MVRAVLALLLLPALLFAGPAAPQTELCRLYPPGPPHAGCGACGGPGVRLGTGRCARWDDVVVPDCRALRGELRDERRCTAGRQRERGRALTPARPPSRPSSQW
jgi:hypothetical protein